MPRRRRLGTLRIVGVPVEIRYPVVTGRDRFCDDIVEYTDPVTIENVLIKPNSDTAMTSATRDEFIDGHPDAIAGDIIFYFPREFDENVRGAIITYRGVDYDVVGEPERYIDENLPWACDWNLVVKGTMHDG